jgi:hypothetical protein
MKYIFIFLLAFNVSAESYHQFDLRYQQGEKLSDLDSSNLAGFGFTFSRDIGDFFYKGSLYHQQGGDVTQEGFEIGAGYNIGNLSTSYSYFGETLHEYWDTGGSSKGSPIKVKDTDWRELHRIRADYHFNYVSVGYSVSFLPSNRKQYQNAVHLLVKHDINKNYAVFAGVDYYLDNQEQRYLDAPLFKVGFRYFLD